MPLYRDLWIVRRVKVRLNLYTVFLSNRDSSALELLISYYRHLQFLIGICNRKSSDVTENTKKNFPGDFQ